ncbi:hypothetical protein [Muricauda sp. MAR_2010_75]|uniref:hypothetical protein n=1 Tax=Allomuricauda sp. MAR_2010_75 TaxID=1250232 RepID=UPI0005605D73|nr:hypothetical protein [Muricauda sp. MAR_2010_75]
MLLTPKDFAKAIGKSYGTIRQHISRKKIFKSGDFIDTDYELNKLYILSQTNGRGLNFDKIDDTEIDKPKNPTPKKTTKPTVEKPTPPPTKEVRPASEPSQEEVIRWNLDLRKKQADAEKSERDNELKRIEIQRKMGKLMPIELVEKILTVNIQAVFRSFETEAENIASTYCEILGGDRTHLSEMADQMRKHLQKAIEETKSQSAIEVNQAIKDYAEVRNRGERK